MVQSIESSKINSVLTAVQFLNKSSGPCRQCSSELRLAGVTQVVAVGPVRSVPSRFTVNGGGSRGLPCPALDTHASTLPTECRGDRRSVGEGDGALLHRIQLVWPA